MTYRRDPLFAIIVRHHVRDIATHVKDDVTLPQLPSPNTTPHTFAHRPSQSVVSLFGDIDHVILPPEEGGKMKSANFHAEWIYRARDPRDDEKPRVEIFAWPVYAIDVQM